MQGKAPEQEDCRPAGTATAQSPWRRRAWLAVLGIVVGVLVAFAHWPALRAQALSFDDGQYLAENPLVQRPGWASARRFFVEVLEPSTVHGYYQPLAMVSLMLDYAIGGRVENLRPFHRTSLILHVANTLLVMALLYALFGRPWVAAGAALLFGVHPLPVEPVPWVGERKPLLAAFFALLCMLAYVRYARRGGRRAYLACVVLYVLALLSKPTSTPLPLVLLLMDFWPLRCLSRRAAMEKVPLLILGVVFAVITVISQKRTAGVEMPGAYPAGMVPLIFCHDIVFYLSKIFWPTHLTSHYPVPQPLSLANSRILVAVVVACMLIIGLAVSLRRTRALVTGWLIFLVALFPTMGLIGFTNVLTSDKYAYLPAVGYLLVLARLLERLAGDPSRGRPAWRPVAVGLGTLGAASLLTFGTRAYLREWQTSERLASHMLRQAPHSPHIHFQYGNALRDKGDYRGAIDAYSRAIALAPAYDMFYNNRGIARAAIGEYDCAIRDYTRAIELNPDHAMAYNNRAIAYAAVHDYERALQDYTRALALKADYAEAYHNRGNAYREMRDYDRAILDYTRAIERKPDFEEAYNNRGNAYREKDDYDRAIRDYTRAIDLRPDFESAYVNRGHAYARRRDYAHAVQDYSRALALNPRSEQAYTARGNAYSRIGDYRRAILDYTEAIRLKPRSAESYNNRGSAFGQAGDYEQAIRDFTKAIELKPDYARAYYNRALAQYARKDYPAARADIEAFQRLGGQVRSDLMQALSAPSTRPG